MNKHTWLHYMPVHLFTIYMCVLPLGLLCRPYIPMCGDPTKQVPVHSKFHFIWKKNETKCVSETIFKREK